MRATAWSVWSASLALVVCPLDQYILSCREGGCAGSVSPVAMRWDGEGWHRDGGEGVMDGGDKRSLLQGGWGSGRCVERFFGYQGFRLE